MTDSVVRLLNLHDEDESFLSMFTLEVLNYKFGQLFPSEFSSSASPRPLKHTKQDSINIRNHGIHPSFLPGTSIQPKSRSTRM
jgi:hypothetical protein